MQLLLKVICSLPHTLHTDLMPAVQEIWMQGIARQVNAVAPITLRNQVYEQLRQAILDRRLKPGDHVREQEFTEMLGVSRTPLREALGLLEQDGLVRNFPNRGWFVTKLTPSEIEEIFIIRSALENLAADLMIDRLTQDEVAELEASIQALGRAIESGNTLIRTSLDRQFHQRLVELANNKSLLHIWQNITVQCALAFNYHLVTMPDYDHMQGVRDHTAILDALRSRDAARVHAVNDEINRRVAMQCIAGYEALKSISEYPLEVSP
jgi:DNA-binding GntR family transcriptional regulator